MKVEWGKLPLLLWAAAIAMSCAAPAPAHAEGKTRQKVIDFEDEVVEGVNRRPWDSLSQISESDKRKRKPHLYRKRVGFTAETNDAIRTIASTP